MRRAEQISLFSLKQEIQALDDISYIILAGHGDDDVGFDQIQRVNVVVDVVWEGQIESFQQLGHAPSWFFEEEAHFDVGLREEGVDVGGVDFIVPAHGFCDCDFERPLCFGVLCLRESVVLCESRRRCVGTMRRHRFLPLP